jgi:mono/diheme cytochrome c family protein
VNQCGLRQHLSLGDEGGIKMNHLRVRLTAVAILLFALVLISSGPLHAQDAAALYKTKCSACHAADGSGSGAMGKQLGVTDLRSDDVQKQTDAQLTDSVMNGKGKKMPAYKDKLTNDQIKGLVGYLRELAKKK